MYRDLYSAIMCRPLLSAERQGENEEEKVRPGQRPLLTRADRKTASGGPASFSSLVQARKIIRRLHCTS